MNINNFMKDYGRLMRGDQDLNVFIDSGKSHLFFDCPPLTFN